MAATAQTIAGHPIAMWDHTHSLLLFYTLTGLPAIAHSPISTAQQQEGRRSTNVHLKESSCSEELVSGYHYSNLECSLYPLCRQSSPLIAPLYTRATAWNAGARLFTLARWRMGAGFLTDCRLQSEHRSLHTD